ncbi:response regulator [Pedosphaera parvula]|uniref:Response regulator receiver protein n=1 Tax=Pedosphaera parvula (strain Ellin514) TaxID=320771 RepID=B9XJF9_PEDPL|nr:response regulator [Pedosphaera parvula]EEF60020.1 response regulator receiver protein [Pedosphaera parvula Ellin514]
MSRSTVILHVEDDTNDVTLVNLMHRKGKFESELKVVGDGEEAISYLGGMDSFADREKYPFPNLVLLDLKLPKKSGLEVLQWIRSNAATRRLPVIMLTSSNQQDDIRSAYDLGANSYLVKPGELSSLGTLLKVIHEYWLGMNQPAVMESIPVTSS